VVIFSYQKNVRLEGIEPSWALFFATVATDVELQHFCTIMIYVAAVACCNFVVNGIHSKTSTLAILDAVLPLSRRKPASDLEQNSCAGSLLQQGSPHGRGS
jgi:hypothetical protein